MRILVSILVTIQALFFLGCPVASSRMYKPLDWEQPLLEKADKSIMPSDVKAAPEKYLGNAIHWVGIVDSFALPTRGDTIFSQVYLEQKYYDYIEDFSIQRETIFLSSHGEGKFVFNKDLVHAPLDTVLKALSVVAKRGALAFCYGTFTGLRNGIPVIQSSGIRFIPSEFYSTGILSYEVERDSTGRVVMRKNGFPELTNIRIIKIPGAGTNK